ncbi:HAD family hydrolase, partial [Klebsiella pneumoniae]|nr:HAD family hydrolase [Klebsiella pneumoniae]
GVETRSGNLFLDLSLTKLISLETGARDDAEPAQAARQLEGEGRTVSWLMAADGDARRVLGLLAFGDTLKPGARAGVARLRELGIKTVMLTGDNRG